MTRVGRVWPAGGGGQARQLQGQQPDHTGGPGLACGGGQ